MKPSSYSRVDRACQHLVILVMRGNDLGILQSGKSSRVGASFLGRRSNAVIKYLDSKRLFNYIAKEERYRMLPVHSIDVPKLRTFQTSAFAEPCQQPESKFGSTIITFQ